MVFKLLLQGFGSVSSVREPPTPPHVHTHTSSPLALGSFAPSVSSFRILAMLAGVRWVLPCSWYACAGASCLALGSVHPLRISRKPKKPLIGKLKPEVVQAAERMHAVYEDLQVRLRAE